MITRDLPTPLEFDATSQRILGLFAAQLDDQTRLLKKSVEGFDVSHLEWQPFPGMNTVGMLLAHIAVAETYWMNVAPKQISLVPEGDDLILGILGIHMDDDGMPMKPDGEHPATLKGKTLPEYFEYLDKARASTHKVLQAWTDPDLKSAITTKKYIVTNVWMVYHILEHLCGHYGQILLLRHMMRQARLLPQPVEVE